MSELTEVQLENLEEELEVRQHILATLQQKKATADDRERGKIDRLIEAVNKGDFTGALVKSILKDIKRQRIQEDKANRVTAAKMTIDQIIDTYNFHVGSFGSTVYYYQTPNADMFGNRNWIAIKKDALQASFPATDVYVRMGEGEEDYSSYKEFNRRLVEKSRTFTRIIQSYKDEPGALNLMTKDFCLPAADGSTDYHWIFDAVLETVSGGPPGDRDTFEAMQRTIFAKWLHPDNPFIPNPTIRDVNGRAAKGLMANTFLRRLFNGNIADNCNSDHVIGKFNGVIAGKAVVIVNETNRSKIDSERVKAFLGSPRIVVENKYQVPYYADNTCLVFFFTNDPNGGVNVSGTSSDNRFSFFKVRQNIYKTCQRYFREREGVELTEREVQTWIEGTDLTSGQIILFDQEQVGRWINAMAVKHGDVKTVEPVHGDEHRAILDKQRGAWTRTVEEVFRDPDFQYIRANLLSDLVREYNRGEMLPGRNKMRDEIERLIADRALNIELVQRAVIQTGLNTNNTIQRTVYRKIGIGNVMQDETAYGQEDQNGRWIWTWVA